MHSSSLILVNKFGSADQALLDLNIWQTPGTKPRPRRLAAILLLILLAAGAIFAVSYLSSMGGSKNSWSITQSDASRVLDSANFTKMPDANSSQIVEQTASDAKTLEPLSATEAQAANSRIAPTSDRGPAALPLLVPLGDGLHYLRALDCMTAAIYYEAANEPVEGQRAVAQVILNRSRHLAYPHTICGVVYQGAEKATGCQFSFTCDGSLHRTPSVEGWRRARSIASAALGGLVYAPVGLATHYHADYVLPYWAPKLVKQTVLGRHIFYRWPGTWGTRRSFVTPYNGDEPDISANKQLAVAMPNFDSSLPLTPTAADTVDTKERPILMGGALPAIVAPLAPTQVMAASGLNRDGRKYLMSKAPPSPAQAPPPPLRRGVTGGVLMPGSTFGGATPSDNGDKAQTPKN